MTTAKRKKLKEKEKRARERVRKIKAKGVKAKEKAKIAKVKRKAPKRKSAKRKAPKRKAAKRKAPKYLRHKAKSSYLDDVLKQRTLEKIEEPDKGKIYKNEKLVYGTQEEKDQIDRNRKQAADDAAETRKRNAAKKGKLRR